MTRTPTEPELPARALDPAPLEPALIQIPAAWVLMGSHAGQDCERPIHRVWIDAFQLAATQVTNAEYARFLTATGNPRPPCWNDPNFNHPQQPVTAVSWFEAVRYCEWLHSQTARPYRLPTEAEWELAARGGLEQNNYPWGDDPAAISPATTPRAGKPAPNQSPATPPTPSAFTTSATTSTNGAATGTIRITTPLRPSATRAAPNKAR
jgi:sulfatase modifying factor 1